MREDFFYRIHILPISLPPLRDRKEDIPLLLDHFLERHYGDGEKPPLPFEVWEAFQSYNWPGNVRELQNVLQTYVTLGRLDFMGKIQGTVESTGSPSLYDIPADAEGLREAVDAFEKKFILHTLEKTRWHRSRAASVLKLDRRTLHRKMEAHRIK
jgi:transcriptional regulator with PAS, ATPase and Fis domain